MEADQSTRTKIIERIINILGPHLPDSTRAIEMLLGIKPADSVFLNATHVDDTSPVMPVVFISYSWDGEEHKKWVYELAQRLSNNGIKVILAQYSIRLGGICSIL